MAEIDPFQVATQGVGPGWTTFSMATQGFGFKVEIEIKKPTGGGWGPAPEYEIIIRVSYKGKKWEEKRRVSNLIGRGLEKVVATFDGFKVIPEKIKMVANFVKVTVNEIIVKIKKG